MKRQIEASFNLKTKYIVRSELCQHQRLSDCLPCATANLDILLSGGDVSKVNFDQRTLRSYLVRSLLTGSLYFPKEKCKSRGGAKVFPYKFGK